MDPARFARLKEIVIEARKRGGAERERFLDEACADDPELRREVGSLLAHETGRDSVLRTGGVADHGSDGLTTEDEPPPESIGPFRIRDVLGRGGMGVVYRAEQTEPIRREVALKVVKRGMDTDRIVSRFQAERQTLAALDHPNIAKILDAGAEPSGRPYFVMELVAGAPLTTFCDEQRLDTDSRLDLFLDVCRAVQHAHQKGIIHRDLKPSNVLVYMSDGRPVAKVIDFGIAKAIDDTVAERVAMTMDGQIVGTPDYMSPEQAGIVSAGVDTRSDVYSLGALLYEVLSGRRPRQLDATSARDIRRALSQDPPERPSDAAVRSGDTDEITRRRRTTTEGLRRELAGDLDNIVLMAMRTEPDRRYPSVDALAEDIERYRRGMPVRAHADTFRYRAGKFVRRNRVVVAAVGAAILVLVAFAVTTALQSERIRTERDRALAAEEIATEKAETARRVSEFMVEIFEVADPSESRGNTITAREILDRGARRIRSELADQPQVRASLLDAIGRVYQSLGLFPTADSLLTDALTLRRETTGPRSLETAESLNNRGMILHDMGRYDEARVHFEEALDIRRAELGDRHEEVATTLYNLGALVQDMGDLDAADSVFQQVLILDRELLGEDHPYLALDINNLAGIKNARGDPEGASVLYRQALDMNRRIHGDDHPEVATCMANLGNTLHQMGEVDSAIVWSRRALELRRRLLGEEHAHVAISMQNLAMQLQTSGQLDSAEVLIRQAVAMKRRTQGEGHPSTAHNLLGLGSILRARGAYEESERVYREALAIQQASLREDHPHIARSMHGVGLSLLVRDRADEALPFLELALEIRREELPPDHRETLTSMSDLARCYIALERFDEAERLLLSVHETALARHGADHRRTRDVSRRLVALYTALGDSTRASRYAVGG